MDHLKEALLSKIKHSKLKNGGHSELNAASEGSPEEEHSESAAEEKQEDMDVAPDLADRVDEKMGNQDLGHPGMGYDEKSKLLETLVGHGDARNPRSLSGMAREHMKKDLHAMKGKKSY